MLRPAVSTRASSVRARTVSASAFSSGLTTTTNRAYSGTHSVAGNAISGGNDSSWLLHYWGDTNVVSPGSVSCGQDCPGGATPEFYVTFRYYLEAANSLATAPYGGWPGLVIVAGILFGVYRIATRR